MRAFIGSGGEGDLTGRVGWLLIGLALLAVALTGLVWLHTRIRRRKRQLFHTVFNGEKDATGSPPSSPSAQPQWPASSASESSFSCSSSKVNPDVVSKDIDEPEPSVSTQPALLAEKEPAPAVEYEEEWIGCKDLWIDYDGMDQPDDAPNGAYQRCYWTDGMYLCRFKSKGIWHYATCEN